MIKRVILALLTFVFLVILAPVLAFSMVAPLAMDTILLWWSSFVAIVTVIGGTLFLWVYLESR